MCWQSSKLYIFGTIIVVIINDMERRVMPPLGCVYFEYRLLCCLPYRCSALSRKTCSFVRFLTTSHRSPAATFHSQLHSISLISSERFFVFSLSLALCALSHPPSTSSTTVNVFHYNHYHNRRLMFIFREPLAGECDAMGREEEKKWEIIKINCF